MPRFEKHSELPFPAEDVFAWHARPGALERLVPPWENVRLLRHDGIRDGDRAELELRVGPFHRRWVAIHRDHADGRQFVDEQVSGPFARWRHAHRFVPSGATSSRLEDEVDYRLPLAPVGNLVAGRLARRTLERTFAFRHRRTLDDMTRHESADRPLRIAVTGSSGFIGRALTAFLTTGGHRVDRVVRGSPSPGTTEISWDLAGGEIDVASLEGVDVVCHLAGESIAGRWTESKKAAIRDSRLRGTRLVAEAVAGLERRPAALVCASAVGYYGDRGDESLSEESPPGDGFLAEVVKVWEGAADPARDAGIRVVHLRQGVILGSVLPRMLTPFKLGAGGPIGSGRQFWSWIALDDLLGAWHCAIVSDELRGPVNVVSPAPVRNADFAKALGRVLRRPAVLPLPAPVVRTVFGELGDALLLASQRVAPTRLEAAGFRFLYPDLEPALRHELGK